MIFRHIIVILLILFSVSYIFFNIFCTSESSTIIAVISWLSTIALLSVFSDGRIGQKMQYNILLVIIVFALYTFCRYVWFTSIMSDNFIAYTRLESYLNAYQSMGRIVVMDEHGTNYSLYLLSYMLLMLFNGNKMLYINSLIILEYAITVLAWKILLKNCKVHDMRITIIILALLSSYIVEIMIRAATVFQIILLIILLYHLIQEKRADARFLPILFILSTSISLDNPPNRLFMSIILLMIIIFGIFRVKCLNFQNKLIFTVVSVLPILATTTHDVYSLKYIMRYKGYLYTYAEYALQLLFGIETPRVEFLGFSKSAMQFPYPLNVLLSAIRFITTLSYITCVIFAIFLSIYCIAKKEADIISHSISATYLTLATLAGVGYLAQYAALKPFDYFIILQPRFFPLLFLFMLFLNPPSCIRVFAYPSKKVFITTSSFTFTFLMATMMLLYLNNDVLSAIVPQEILSPFSHSGYNYDISETLLFLRNYGTKVPIVISANQKTVCFLFSYISGEQSCREIESEENLNVIYRSLSYVLGFIEEHV